MVEAFADRDVPHYLIRDRDASYGQEFRHRVRSLGMKEAITAARSPWQNAFAPQGALMTGLSTIVDQLRGQRKQLQDQLKGIEQAIAALGALAGCGKTRFESRPPGDEPLWIAIG